MNPSMRLVTWNINSIRTRTEQLAAVVAELRPDVLCLQETKTQDIHFPFAVCHKLGYPHCAIAGQKSYNGVAILSRLPLQEQAAYPWCGKPDARHVMARVAGVEIHNFYIPAGGEIPDTDVNPKFAHKLGMLTEIQQWFAENRKPDQPLILCGDLNIAPSVHDVWSHQQMRTRVSHTPVECALLDDVRDRFGWIDAVRLCHPEPTKLFSWWSYRAKDWQQSNRGLRLDHVWVTPILQKNVSAALVAKEFRNDERPSDHAPVVVDFSF